MMHLLLFACLVQDDPQDLLRQGLEATAKAGGFKFEGEAKTESPLTGLGIRIPGLETGADGTLTGVAGSDGAMILKLDGKAGMHEVFRKGTRTVQRRTWIGGEPEAAASGLEMTSVASPSRLARAAGDRAAAAGVKKETAPPRSGAVLFLCAASSSGPGCARRG